MSRISLLCAALVLALSACDPKESSKKEASLTPPDPTSLNRPKKQPTLDLSQRPATRSLATTAESSGQTDLESLEGYTSEGRRKYDGSGVMPVSYTPSVNNGFPGARSFSRKAGMAIDTDGRVVSDPHSWTTNDPHRKPETSLRYADARRTSLDPTKVPFIVLPLGFQGAKLGDLVYVEYRGRGSWGIVGDYGPRFGEASSYMAATLGIPANGVTGGVEGGVTYTVFPGTGKRYSSEADLQGYLRSKSADLQGRPATRLVEA